MIDRPTRDRVRRRAGDACEYCHLLQSQEPWLTMHVEHVIACHHCNLRKGSNLTALDPKTGQVVRLFHPRRMRWTAHFRLEDGVVSGLTLGGRATVRLLQMNAQYRVDLRCG